MALISKYNDENINSRPKASDSVKGYTDTATGKSDAVISASDYASQSSNDVENMEFSTDSVKEIQAGSFSVDDMTEEGLSSYIDNLVAVYGFTEEEVEKIIIDGASFEEVFDSDYDAHLKAMDAWFEQFPVVDKGIRDSLHGMHQLKSCSDALNFVQNFPYVVTANGISSEMGIPVTDDLIDIIRKNGIDSSEFDNYCNEHFTEYSEFYINNYLGNYFSFTDEQKAELLKCKTMDEFNKLADEKGYILEASDRKLCADYVYGEYQYMLIAQTGCYTFEELDEKIANLEEEIEKGGTTPIYMAETDLELQSQISSSGDKETELDELKKARETIKAEIDKRTEDELLYKQILSSGVLEGKYEGVPGLDSTVHTRLDYLASVSSTLHPVAADYVFEAMYVMSDEEKKLFCYLYDTYGMDAAESFLSRRDFESKIASYVAINEMRNFTDVHSLSAEDYAKLTEISEEEAMNIATGDNARPMVAQVDENGQVHYYLGREGAMYMMSYVNGVETTFEIAARDYTPTTEISMHAIKEDNEDFLKGILFENDEIGILAKGQVDAAYDLYKGGHFIHDAASAVSGFVRNKMISVIPVVGPYLVVGANFASDTSNKYHQTMVQGYSSSRALSYAMMSSGVDTAFDIVTGKIPVLRNAKGVIDQSYLLTVASGFLSGGMAYTGENLIRSATLNEEFTWNWDDFLYQAGMGAFSSALFNLDKLKYAPRNAKFLLNAGKGMADGFNNFKSNMMQKSSAVKNLMDEYGLTKREAKNAYELNKQLELDNDDLVAICKISKDTSLSLEESTLVHKIKNDNNIDLNEAVQVYHNMLSLGLDQADAVKIAAVQKMGLDIDYDKLGDEGYIRDLLAMGDLAVSRDINSVKAMKASGKITQTDVDKFFNLFNDSLLGDEFLSWIKNSDVGFVLYADLMNSTERAGLSMDDVTSNIDLLSAMMGYYVDGRDNLNKPTNLKDFADAYVFNKQASHFDAYRTHGIVHVLDVYNKSMETYAEFKSAGVTGLDHETIAIAAMMHDTGMSGKFEMVSDISIAEDGTGPDGSGKIVWKDMARTSEDDILSVGRWRGQHSANSGRIILENADTLREFGYSDLQIAEASLLAFVHSKSNSGVRQLTNNDNGWSFAINALAASNEDFDLLGVLRENGLITGVKGPGEIQIGKNGKPDTYKFNYDEFSFNSDWIEKMAYEGLIVRIGDALTNNDNGLTNQYGDVIHINYDNYVNQRTITDSLAECGFTSMNKDILGSLDDLAAKEAEKIQYKIGDKTMEVSQQYVLGEDNQTYSIRKNPETGGVDVVVSIKSANDLPFCTLFALNERLGELDSRGTELFKASSSKPLSLVIEFDETPNADVRSTYELFRDNMSSVTPIVINYPNG